MQPATHTKSIILYIEEIKNGVAFMEMAKEVTKLKPIVEIGRAHV